LIQCYYRREPKLTLFILDSSISSKLFFLEVQYKDHLLLIQCYHFQLLLVLEVMQFARDAHQAEGWLLTQEPYLKKDEEKNAVCISCSLQQNE
jgi:hypothetical protein